MKHFFNKLGNKIRGKLSHYPILYAFIGGTGTILFWRGLWHIADDINLNNIISLMLGMIILVITGVFVSEFIGNRLIISGLIGEKRIEEKEELEIETEDTRLEHIDEDLEKKITDKE